MKYRLLGNTGLRVSEVALGCEGAINAPFELVREITEAAIAGGMNFLDIFCAEPDVRDAFGTLLKPYRSNFYIQGHVGACWHEGQYLRTREQAHVVPAFEDLLARLQTDYLDIGVIHYVDTDEDLDAILNGWFITYMQQLKAQGRIRHIGLSSHNPAVALRAVRTGLIEVLLFAVNPCYDLQPPREVFDEVWTPDNYKEPLTNIDPVREELYATCEANGIGLVVMKAFGGGDLLDAEWSPFGIAMRPEHCLHYALTRPAAACVVGGYRSGQEALEAARYSDLSDQERDYAPFLANVPRHSYIGKCIYCGHCAPCAVGIHIAQVNKFHDLTRNKDVPPSVADHYRLLPHHAGECIACGQCESNCPFGVQIIDKMKQAVKTFGY
jgi:predicted aldo/keto reductase-like oxidoreductase